MSRLTLKLKAAPTERVDLGGLLPGLVAGKSNGDIERIAIGTSGSGLTIGDLFTVSGSAGDKIVIAGGSDRLDNVGAGLTAGSIEVEGDIGAFGGAGMTGGHLLVWGNAGPLLGAAMKNGLVHVKGSAGELAGGARPTDRYGVLGGIIVVDGDVGERSGYRMRRGTILAGGTFGRWAGWQMMGGTLWTRTGFGDEPGMQMRRGTLIGPRTGKLLATFRDGGVHDLVILRILSRDLTERLGSLAPPPLPKMVRKYSGDLAIFGKGELLLTE
jgi:formylmethanofuran dehydrogenase subunit C